MTEAAVTGKCPICGKAAAEKLQPFCSKRCAMIDLGQWLGEGYALPAQEYDEEDILDPVPTPGMPRE